MADLKISQLQPISSCNGTEEIPMSLNGSSAKVTVGQIAEYAATFEGGADYYGCSFTGSNPDGVREGNYDLHRTLPIHNLMHGCLLDDNGNETLQLPNGTWAGQDRSGNSGQVMISIPNFYFKCFYDSGVVRFQILNKAPQKGVLYSGWNQFFGNNVDYVYCSAYEASLDRTSGKLASVINTAVQFRGGNNTSAWDNTYRSLLGKPVTNLNRTQFRTAARLRNTGNTSWNEYIYAVHVMLSWLFYIEYNTLNSQKPYNPVLDINGFKQGGLGMGVSEITNWEGYNGNNPFIPCGASDSLGNGSGVVTYNVLDSNSNIIYAAPVPRYRGIENPFGHLWKWSDGINITEDGTTRLAYVSKNPAIFNDNNVTGYLNRGAISHQNGWIKNMILGVNGTLLPSTVGGSSSTYWCDYYWLNTAPNLYGALLGGAAAYGASDGFGCVGTYSVPSGADVGFGSRLCFV